MSYTRFEAEPAEYDERRRFLHFQALGTVPRVGAWAVANAMLVFVEHLAELAAPLLLLAGGVWYAVPKVLAAITLEGPANDILEIIRSRVPHDIYLDGSYYSAGTLIWDGVFLVAVIAICRTLSTAVTTLLLDRD